MALDMEMVRTLLGLPQDSKDEEVVNKILELRMKGEAVPVSPPSPNRNPHPLSWWEYDPGPTVTSARKKPSAPYWMKIVC